MKGCRLVARQSAPGAADRRQSGKCRPVGLQSDGADLSGAILIGAHMDFAATEAPILRTRSPNSRSAKPGTGCRGLPTNCIAQHARWVETDGREGKPADLTDMDLRRLKLIDKRPLTALDRAGSSAVRPRSGRRLAAGQQSAGRRPAFGQSAQAPILRGVNLSGAKLNHADLRDAKLGPLHDFRRAAAACAPRQGQCALCRFPRRGSAPDR